MKSAISATKLARLSDLASSLSRSDEHKSRPATVSFTCGSKKKTDAEIYSLICRSLLQIGASKSAKKRPTEAV